MARIQQLDTNVVKKIAAGEVIERPASVVKELLENSVDALATRVEVDVGQGGSEWIRVVDNGEGIHPDDVPLTIASHATSKIRSAEDLFRVETMGFRGEALASIASVSRFHLRTRRHESETGAELLVDLGQPQKPQPCGCPVGTSIEIRQLFGNTPVRRRFLKTTATEFGHISERFTRIMLPHPRLHATLRHNGKPVFELPATDDFGDRLRLFYGDSLADHLIRVEAEIDDVRLWGYVAHPSQSKSTRKGQYLFLNGRWIEDRSLGHALSEAYRGLLMTGRHAIAFLFLEVPPDGVDVNVHPTKAEVRFREPQLLYRLLLSTLRTRFLGMNLDSTVRISNGSNASSTATSEDSPPKQELQNQLADWAKDQLRSWKPTDSIGSAPTTIVPNRPVATAGEAVAAITPSSSAAPVNSELVGASDAGVSAEQVAAATGGELSPQNAQNEVAGDTVAEDVSSNASAAARSTARIMQIHDCYLVVETDEGLTVIDQHALHERIVYEHLRRRVLSGAVESQKLLVPMTIELSASETSALSDHQDLLAELGFAIEEFGGTTVLLSAYPPMLARANLSELIRDVAEQLAGAEKTPSRRDILDSLLHMMSCKAAIKAGQRLAVEEMESLLEQRHLVDDAHHCPHGRPTALVLSRAELDRQFGRLG